MMTYGRIFDTPRLVSEPGADIGQIGSVPVPSIQMTISLSWAIKNEGDADGYGVLKVWVIEKKGWPATDVEWVVYTPLAREGGPGLDVDIVADETDLKTEHTAPWVLVRPGAIGVARTHLYLPGYDVTAAMRDFWEKHAGAPFKVVVQALQVDVDGEFIADLGAHTFDEAFRLETAVAEAKLEATTSYQDEPQPELSLSIFLEGYYEYTRSVGAGWWYPCVGSRHILPCHQGSGGRRGAAGRGRGAWRTERFLGDYRLTGGCHDDG